MKNARKLFALLITRLPGTGLIVCLSLLAGAPAAIGQTTSEPDFTYGKPGKKRTTINNYEKSTYVVEEFLDEKGIVREKKERGTSKTTGKIIFDRVELFDCEGIKTYDKEIQSDSVTGQTTHFYEDRFKNGKRTYGYQWEIDANGKKVTMRFNAKTGTFEDAAFDATPQTSEVGTPQHDASVCSRPFQPNEVAGFFSFIREDSNPRFNTYGGGASYTRFINSNVGLTADFNANFRTQNGADLSKISVLGGVTFLPFDSAQTTDKVTFSTHALLGVSHFSSDTGPTTFTDNTFTMKLGGALDLNVTDNFFIRPVQIDYAPTFFGDNAQHNVQFAVGGGFRFGRK